MLKSAKADTQSSDPRVHYPEECSKAKVVENYQYTFALMRETIETVFRTIISVCSVLTEQSQICVKNAKLVLLEQGDLLWQDNLTRCLCQQVR